MSDLRWLGPEINFRRGISYAGGLVAIGVIYFALAKGGLALASIHPSATPIWPPTGVALAAVLLWGYRTWPAIFTAAVIVMRRPPARLPPQLRLRPVTLLKRLLALT